MSEDSSAAPTEVRHDAAAHRFALEIEGSTAVLEYAQVDAGTLDYRHTFVPPALRGRGLASVLTEHALRYARDHALKVVPTCPFVSKYVERHPEYRTLLKA